MNALIYNTAIGAGVALVGFGTWQINRPVGLIVTGALVIGLTIFAALAFARKP